MSKTNVEIALRMGEAFRVGDMDAVRSHYHPEIEWHEDPSFPESGVFRGIDAVGAYSRQFWSEFSEIQYDMAEVIEAGDHVLVNMRITGRGRTSGAAFDVSAWWVFEFRDGKVVRCHSYLDRDAAVAASGMENSSRAVP
jgi:ketosteroid isomerase-like protein